jgi:hypothetical protein
MMARWLTVATRQWRLPAVRVAAVGLFGMATVGLVGAASPAGVAAGASPSTNPGTAILTASVRLSGPSPSLPADAQVIGPADPTAAFTADVFVRPAHPAALAAFAAAVSTPGSPQYHRYLAPGQFAGTFGPTATTLAATRAWLSALGLRVGTTSVNGLLIPVTGTVAQMDGAFSVHLVDARLRGGRVARATTTSPAVPSSLAGAIGGVIGLSDIAQSHPQIRPGTVAGVATPGSPAAGAQPHAEGALLGPVACGAASALTADGAWTADQLASTYGFDALYGQGRVGAGQQVGIFELEPFTPSDIENYEACFGADAPVSTVAVDGGATGPQIGEAALDIEVVAGLAPASAITVFSGPNSGAGPIDTYTQMVDDPSIKVLTTSWGQCEGVGGIDPSEQQAETALFQQAAAQGQSVMAAAGDSGSSDCYDPPHDSSQALSVDDPADQPDVTGVGGTTLTSVAPDAPTESVWNGGPSLGAGGGGNSVDFAAPSWQQIPEAQSHSTLYTCGSGSQQCREVPDVAASSDPDHGDVIFFDGQWQRFGGTSTAAPLWAALTAVSNQGCAVPAGFLNQQLYAAGPGPQPPFNDVTVGNNDLFDPSAPPSSAVYPATAHYDLASGWGSPRAAGVMGQLSGSSAGCPAVTGLAPDSGPATGGTTVVISGAGFGSGLPVVRFGGVPATVIQHTPTSVTVTSPDVRSAAQLPVTVTTAGAGAGTSAAVSMGEYTFVSPQVRVVEPDKGPTSGGGTVTVSGSDFLGATSVQFGSAPATFTVTSPTSIEAQVPAGPAAGGTVDVTVQSADGISPVVAGDRYTYALPGYWLVAADGGVFAYGDAGFYGSTGGMVLNRPVVGMAGSPDDHGYWLVASDGGVFAYGDAGFYGSTGGTVLNRPIVAMAPTPDGGGYWLVASDGGVFAYGDAGFYGSAGGTVLNRPIVAMAPTPDGGGYWLVASDGGVFAYGDAGFYGSTGGTVLNRPIVAMASTPDGGGYWLVASDGGVFAYGDAGFYGSAGGMVLNRPVVGSANTLGAHGYWLVASDGGVFAYGDAGFYGSTGGVTLDQPIVGMAST